mgnify:CR=1 FL=1
MSIYQQYLNYLNQAMPDISGIFPNNTTTPDDPTNDPVTDPEPGVTPDLLNSIGGGDNFTVYNPDPTRLRTKQDYINPFPFNPDDNLGTSDYGYPGSPKTGLEGLYDQYKALPMGSKIGLGAVSALSGGALIPAALGVYGIGKGISSLLPPNKRAIIENEALGAGFALNDIGQIVATPGDAYDPSGLNIMAGYNLAKIDQSTFDKRRANAKKNMSPEGFKEFNKALTAAEEKILGKKGIKNIADSIYDSQMKKKDPTYKTLDEKIAFGLAEGDDDDDDYNFEDYIASMVPYGIKSSYPGVGFKERKDIIQEIGEKNIQEAIDKANEEKEKKKKIIDAGGTAPDGGYATDYYGGGADAGGSAPGGGYATDYYGGGADAGGGPSYGGMGSIGSGGNQGGGNQGGGKKDSGGGESKYGGFCFDPNTLIQMADGSEKKIKEIQLGDQTKGGEVTGVFQFKASDEIHDYKGVTVAGSHYVKEDGKFIMVKDSPISVKIDKIPVVYSLDTTGRRIFINDIEFADYNGDGIAKGFLANAGVDLSGFDKEVLRQVEHRLI